MDNNQLTEIFKSEYSNLVAVLCHYYGLTDIQFAQDIVSETFYKAMKTWSHNGIPNSPKAWLRKVALNHLKDHYRKSKAFEEKVAPQIGPKTSTYQLPEITNEIIEDSQLRMMFVICNPELNKAAQICLALRILCGFNIEEIAKSLLSNKENINKKLYRAKKAIKEKLHQENQLSEKDYKERLDNVLRVIYLLFNEGYYSSVKEENIRVDICWEAMRLNIFLTKYDYFKKQKIFALLALMCFHASRLEARRSGENSDLLYHDQDRSKWNKDLIKKGEKYLNLSASGTTISKYHIEASIAYWHTLDSEDKWGNILQLYNRLLTIEYSPIIAMNRTYALAMADSIKDAIHEALKFDLKENPHYYCLLAELYRMDGDSKKEINYLSQALQFAKKNNEQEVIRNKLILAQS